MNSEQYMTAYGTVSVTSNNLTDTVQAMYPCGHSIGVPGAAYVRWGQRAIPGVCHVCKEKGQQEDLSNRWMQQMMTPSIHQHFNSTAATSANVTVSGYGYTLPKMHEATNLDWLDFEVKQVQRKAYA